MGKFEDELNRYLVKEQLNSSPSEPAKQKDWNICEICGGKIISRCRCMGPHDLAAIKKGHGRLCENGHRIGDNSIYIMDIAAVEANKKFHNDFNK